MSRSSAQRIVSVAAALGGAALLISAAANPLWRTYDNARFGYSICYPSALLTPQPEADNGDGRVFTGAGGASLRVYGSNNALEIRVAKAAAAERTRLTRAGATISYDVVRSNWYVLSGRQGGSLFYIRSNLTDDQFKTFELRYPAAAAATWNPITTRIAGCFKG